MNWEELWGTTLLQKKQGKLQCAISTGDSYDCKQDTRVMLDEVDSSYLVLSDLSCLMNLHKLGCYAVNSSHTLQQVTGPGLQTCQNSIINLRTIDFYEI